MTTKVFISYKTVWHGATILQEMHRLECVLELLAVCTVFVVDLSDIRGNHKVSVVLTMPGQILTVGVRSGIVG